MQQAIPYRTWPSSAATSSTNSAAAGLHSQPGDSSSKNATINVVKLVLENAVIVIGRRGCCMCHVVKQLLLGLGVNPTLFYVDEEDEAAVTHQLSKIINVGAAAAGDHQVQFPAVFVGGKLFGGLERVMATHISGELVPILREARALWL